MFASCLPLSSRACCPRGGVEEALGELKESEADVSLRQALRYIIRNLQLPARMRAQAQLELGQMHCYTRPTQIKNRCIEGGKGRGILSDFRMSRVCAAPSPAIRQSDSPKPYDDRP